VHFVSCGCSPSRVLDVALGDRFIRWQNHGSAYLMLTTLLRNGAFVAGGFARTVVLEATGMLRDRTFVPEDHFGDIDVFFERDVSNAELKHMVRNCGISDEPRAPRVRFEPPAPCWRDNTASYPIGCSAFHRTGGCLYVSFPDEQLYARASMPFSGLAERIEQHAYSSRNMVRINVITFKHGAPEVLLNDFDVTPCQVAFNSAGVSFVRSDFARVERDGLVGINWEILRTRPFAQLHLSKTVERLAKYVHRVAVSAGTVRVLPGELTKIVRIAQGDDFKRLQRMSWDAQQTLASTAPAEDCIRFAMMVWPQAYMQTRMFERLYKR